MATNDFLVWSGASNANVLSQSAYQALPNLATGAVTGRASSAQFNKTLRQSSIMAAVMGGFINNQALKNATDDGTTNNLTSSLAQAVAGTFAYAFVSSVGPSYTSTAGDVGTLIQRANNGVTMNDTLAGANTFPVGGAVTFKNNDSTAILVIRSNFSGGIDGSAAGASYVALGPSQSCTFVSNGAVWFTVGKPVRPKCMAALNLYVAASGGNATNSGLSASAPLVTIQAALNLAQNFYDLNNFNAVINIAAGTYPENLTISTLSNINLVGAGNTSTIIAPTAAGIALAVSNANVSVAHLELVVPSSVGNQVYNSSGYGLGAGKGSYVTLNDVSFGNCAVSWASVSGGGTISTLGNPIYIRGNSNVGFQTSGCGFFVMDNSTITFTGPVSSNYFLHSFGTSYIQAIGCTFANPGNFSGSQYEASYNGAIATQTSGSNTYLPGSQGSTAYGGSFS